METQEIPAVESRKSWVAYTKVLIKYAIVISIGYIIYSSTYEAFTKEGVDIAPYGTFLLVAVALRFFYRIIYLTSIRLYTDKNGVWIFKGMLPWNKGTNGVKWADLDQAVFFTGFISWVTRSYRIQLKHKYTKANEIFATDMSNGKNVVAEINSLHARALEGPNLS